MGAVASGVLKALQFAVSVGFFGLLWMIYPGTVAGVMGVGHVGAAAAALLGSRVGMRITFAFTIMAGAFSCWGVYRYLDNGFGYLAGNFDGRTGIHWPAYLFLLVATGSLAIVVLRVLPWRVQRRRHFTK